MKLLAIFAFTVYVLTSCGNEGTNDSSSTPKDTAQIAAAVLNRDSLILSITKDVLTALKNEDYKAFAGYFHPVLGVRFSPYGYIDTSSDVRLGADKFIDANKQQQLINWGSYDGSGDTILLSLNDYFQKFVYNADFLHATANSLNKMIGHGNSLNNLETIYKGCDYTESYFPGFDKKYDGMDWTCLRLVYKNYMGIYYLVAIVHDQWTI